MNAATSIPRIEIAPGVAVPQLGLGVFQVPPADVQPLVEAALEAGYRHIDTAAAYNNEAGVGAAVRASGLRREEIVVTSKLRNGEQGLDAAAAAYRDTLTRTGLDWLDLYLIHWPNPAAGLWQDSWRALAGLQRDGDVRAVGVSNFLAEHLDELVGLEGLPVPAVNQIELHPTYQQREVVARCHELDIVVEAYSPLGQGKDLDAEPVKAAAAALGVSPAQVILRWHLQQGRIVIPKTASRQRLATNIDLTGFALDAAQLDAIDALDGDGRIGGDPRTFSISQIR